MKNTTWIVILVLVVLGAGAYMYRGQLQSMFNGSPSTAMPVVPDQSTNPSPAVTESVVSTSLVMTKTDATKGDYLVGPASMTLYSYDKDTAGVSNCTDTCAEKWPPYITTAAPATLPTGVTTLTRADGSIQYAYNGMPLYYWVSDTKPGDTTGDGVGGVWHLVKP